MATNIRGVAAQPAADTLSAAARVGALRARLYPELAAGGFPRASQRLAFMLRVNALLEPSSRVLDFGAGRGINSEACTPFLLDLFDLRNRCARVVGVDVDKAVRGNPMLDEAHVIGIGDRLPFADGSFDLITAHAVLEHIADPAACAAELHRVLKPGGWFCAWTPNRWGYFALAARALPERLHGSVLRRVSPGRQTEDIFPTRYRMNTRRALRRAFPAGQWDDFTYGYDGDVRYHGGRAPLARLWQLWGRLAPPAGCQAWHVFMRRR